MSIQTEQSPYAYHFPWRNRIIAALSEAVIVVEARRRSGSLLTVNEALELDIPVYCVPHAYLDEAGTGCNLLISQGANILVDEDDLRLIFSKNCFHSFYKLSFVIVGSLPDRACNNRVKAV